MHYAIKVSHKALTLHSPNRLEAKMKELASENQWRYLRCLL